MRYVPGMFFCCHSVANDWLAFDEVGSILDDTEYAASDQFNEWLQWRSDAAGKPLDLELSICEAGHMNAKQIKEQEAEDSIERLSAACARDEQKPTVHWSARYRTFHPLPSFLTDDVLDNLFDRLFGTFHADLAYCKDTNS